MLQAVENPASPDYRHFLTPPEFNSRFDPSGAAVARVEAALVGARATDISVAYDRTTVSALLPASSVDSLFGVQLRVFGQAGATPLYAAVGTARLPPTLEGLVTGIGGLTDAANPLLQLATSATVARRSRSSAPPPPSS